MMVPHPIPYQGSKRALASRILGYLPRAERLIEPFAGSAAITLAAAARDAYEHFIVGDTLRPLAQIWDLILTDPERLSGAYEQLWRSQLLDPRRAYDETREHFNQTGDPAALLYLLARCVKASVRFNADGAFNQSPDNRRLGMRPNVMRRHIFASHSLLAGRTEVVAADFRDTLSPATPNDAVYLDPPYQGTVGSRDRRYYQPVTLAELAEELRRLNAARVPFVLSYDGSLGNRTYGSDLPPDLELTRIHLYAGRSSQATLSGRAEVTVESLYLSLAARSLLALRGAVAARPEQVALPL